MEKICIAKLRKGMAYPGHPEEGSGHATGAGKEGQVTRHHGEAYDGSGSVGRCADAAGRTVSLLLTQEQMSALRSNRCLASSLPGGRAEGFAAMQHRDGPLVIKFEFESMPPVRLLKTEEVIQMLRISKANLSRIIGQGMLKSYKIGRLRRIMLADILSYLEDHREATATRPQGSESAVSTTLFVQKSRIKEE